jgi:hypothetical protein
MFRIIGLVFFVVGIALLLFGLNSSQTGAEKLVEDLTGRYSSHTMWYIIGGLALTVAGIALYFVGRRTRR